MPTAKKAMKKPALWSEWVGQRIPIIPNCAYGQKIVAQLKELEKRYPDPLTLYKAVKQARDKGEALREHTSAIRAIAYEFGRVANSWRMNHPVEVDQRDYEDGIVENAIEEFAILAMNKTVPGTTRTRLKAVTAELKALHKLLNNWRNDAPEPDNSLPTGMIPIRNRGGTIVLEAVPETAPKRKRRK